MGMFDDYKIKNPIQCPECEANLRDFQSKAGECSLTTYYEGDPNPDFEHFRYIDVYTTCPEKHFVYLRLSVDEEGRFTPTDKIWVENYG